MIARWAIALSLLGCSRGDPAITERVEPIDAGAGDSNAGAVNANPERDVAAADANAPRAELHAHESKQGLCGEIGGGGNFAPQFITHRDLSLSFINGDDWLALVNRSPLGTLAPDYAPSDLVDFISGKEASAKKCGTVLGSCLRREAADALHKMLAGMAKVGLRGRVESLYRSYGAQCATFVKWAEKESSSFCQATEQSALPGHSQHQLGTTIDLFTEDWVTEGKEKNDSTFRSGFGCTRAGKWLDEHGFEYGFVIPYPIHPDDRQPSQRCLQRWDIPVPSNPRTGYRYEPWHLRYVGETNAREFHEAWLASGPDSPDEISLEQWIRHKSSLVGEANVPVCDGCNCGACATFAKERGPCGHSALLLDESGQLVVPEQAPRIVDASLRVLKDGAVIVDVRVSSPAHTPTQPPIVGPENKGYSGEGTFEAWVPYSRTRPHRFPDLPGAWRIGVGPADSRDWPWRAALTASWLARTHNRANLILPAAPGENVVHIALPRSTNSVRVTLLRDGKEHDARVLPAQGNGEKRIE